MALVSFPTRVEFVIFSLLPSFAFSLQWMVFGLNGNLKPSVSPFAVEASWTGLGLVHLQHLNMEAETAQGQKPRDSIAIL